MNNFVRNMNFLSERFSILNPYEEIVTIKTNKNTYKINKEIDNVVFLLDVNKNKEYFFESNELDELIVTLAGLFDRTNERVVDVFSYRS